MADRTHERRRCQGLVAALALEVGFGFGFGFGASAARAEGFTLADLGHWDAGSKLARNSLHFARLKLRVLPLDSYDLKIDGETALTPARYLGEALRDLPDKPLETRIDYLFGTRDGRDDQTEADSLVQLAMPVHF